MKPVLVTTLLLILGLAHIPAPAQAVEHTTFTPQADLRVRQEVLDGLLHFLPDPDRNQVRFRSRLGGTVDLDENRFRLLLTNEHRRYVRPDGIEFDWDELTVDQLYYQLRRPDFQLTIGRQNIIWDDGFFMLEGHPGDGSRSIWHNALRYQRPGLDVALIRNWREDGIILAGDMDRPLRETDEAALALRLEGDHGTTKLIIKRLMPENDATRITRYTLGYRFEMGCKKNLWWLMEAGVQYMEPDGSDKGKASHAVQTRIERPLGPDTVFHVGGMYYGDDYHTPYGRWPLWSELYIYTLVPEEGVANWNNIVAPFAGLSHQICPRMRLKTRLYYMLAPDPDWQGRGPLLQTRLDVRLNKHLKGHLTWEMLSPGEFHEENVLPLDETVHFLRWEMIVGL
jgi:hypothetical protein